ncbi:carboxypeptidase M-like [Sinocyclocheilus grahami]|uniref:carboxypeptidase M-like n=1 Tax=Sinocyclocheilus grahami TaxID=75366 RepID=UPI0007ACC135|nr:PREDICTED: carboxypeptidase M-like [Sinocyclocheilus grahami]
MNSNSVGVLLSPATCNGNVIDFVSGSELQGGLSISPDDDVFVHLAKTYSYSHSEMHNGNSCYESQDFSHGVTNGYHWYPLPGGMQDYNYVWAQCLELTLEISCCKYPPEAQLPGLWAANKPALLAYMQQVHLGRQTEHRFAHKHTRDIF